MGPMPPVSSKLVRLVKGLHGDGQENFTICKKLQIDCLPKGQKALEAIEQIKDQVNPPTGCDDTTPKYGRFTKQACRSYFNDSVLKLDLFVYFESLPS